MDKYMCVIERSTNSARAIIVDCEGNKPSVIASSTSHSQVIDELVRLANRGARAEEMDELRERLEAVDEGEVTG